MSIERKVVELRQDVARMALRREQVAEELAQVAREIAETESRRARLFVAGAPVDDIDGRLSVLAARKSSLEQTPGQIDSMIAAKEAEIAKLQDPKYQKAVADLQSRVEECEARYYEAARALQETVSAYREAARARFELTGEYRDSPRGLGKLDAYINNCVFVGPASNALSEPTVKMVKCPTCRTEVGMLPGWGQGKCPSCKRIVVDPSTQFFFGRAKAFGINAVDAR